MTRLARRIEVMIRKQASTSLTARLVQVRVDTLMQQETDDCTPITPFVQPICVGNAHHSRIDVQSQPTLGSLPVITGSAVKSRIPVALCVLEATCEDCVTDGLFDVVEIDCIVVVGIESSRVVGDSGSKEVDALWRLEFHVGSDFADDVEGRAVVVHVSESYFG